MHAKLCQRYLFNKIKGKKEIVFKFFFFFDGEIVFNFENLKNKNKIVGQHEVAAKMYSKTRGNLVQLYIILT